MSQCQCLARDKTLPANVKGAFQSLRMFENVLQSFSTVILAQPRVSRLRVAVSDVFRRARRAHRARRASAGEIAGLFCATLTQIPLLGVATLAPFGRSANSAWGWHKSGVPGSNSHADAWPQCRHARTVGQSENSAWGWRKSGDPEINSHADKWPRSRHAAAV